MADRGAKALKGASKVTATTGRRKAVGSKKGGDDEREESWQAIVLADSFETRFNPFTLEKPRCLLPLANTPLIEYTLEFLAMSGVSEIYMYCGIHSDTVEDYIKRSKWNPARGTSPFAALEILRSSARSVGDALRDVDNRGLITGDFLLVHGDIVSNMPIDSALRAHRARRIADKNAIMTMILREGGLKSHRTKAQAITPVFVIDPTKQRCLHYEEMHCQQANRYVNIDPELLAEHAEIEIRADLIDCGIDICTPDVLALWSDSFDYEVPRRHFLHGVLKDYELNGKTLHTAIVADHYAARVNNLQAYDSVSKDILGRWTYPLVPDSNLVDDQSFHLSRGSICKENGVILARNCDVGKKTVLGQNTSIGDGSSVMTCIIGRGCQIGKNVKIRNAYLWDNVTVDDDTIVQDAIIADEVYVGKKCHISGGALISFGVKLSDKTTINGGRITRAKRRRASIAGEPLARMPADPLVVGKAGEGYAFQESDSELDDAVSLQSSLIYSTAHLNISEESVSTLSSSVSAASIVIGDRERLSSFTGSVSDDEQIGVSGESFVRDAVADVFRTLSEGGNFDNTRVEFTSLRLSNNATDHHVHRAIAIAFAKHIAQLIEAGKEPQKAVSQTLSITGAQDFVQDVAIGKSRSLDDQTDFLMCLQKDLCHRDKGNIVLFAMCKELYDLEVLDEDGFEAWWSDARSTESDEMREVRETTDAFIVWLRDADEESDESE